MLENTSNNLMCVNLNTNPPLKVLSLQSEHTQQLFPSLFHSFQYWRWPLAPRPPGVLRFREFWERWEFTEIISQLSALWAVWWIYTQGHAERMALLTDGCPTSSCRIMMSTCVVLVMFHRKEELQGNVWRAWWMKVARFPVVLVSSPQAHLFHFFFQRPRW